MIYVALLRGINVGGNAKVDMKQLAAVFEQLGFDKVKTYINSGNIIFSSNASDVSVLTSQIEAAITQAVGLSVPVVVRDLPAMERVIAALPASWTNDQTMKCDVMFLWPSIDSADILKQVSYKSEIEDVKYIPGTLLWRIDRDKVNQGQSLKIVGTDIYKQMTIRNCNTVRKLLTLMQAT